MNLLWCAPGRVGGSEEYLTRQLQGLGRLGASAGVEMTVYASRAYAAAHEDLIWPIMSPPWSVNSQAVRIPTEHTWLAAHTRGSHRRVDLVHHGGGTAPLIGAGPRVVTVHDLQYLHYPEYFTRVRRAYLRAMMPRSVAGAARVLVPSEFVRTTVVDAFHIAPEQVDVVPHGFEASAGVQVDPQVIRARYGLGDGPVLVYPAITHPHKNHALLLTAMARYWTNPDLRLVFLGGQGAAEVAVAAQIVSEGLTGRVIRPGRVPAADRDALIALADALVFPSRYEGFGAPLIEAMALGTPVVACAGTAVTEVVGSAGLLLADDPEAWAEVPAQIAASRDEWVAAGRARAAEFSLDASASALVAAYRRVRQERM